MRPSRVCFGAARLDEARESETAGARAERALLTALSTSKRRADFLAGRLAAQRALDVFEGRADVSRWVDRDDFGDIHVRHGSVRAEGTYISITHVDGLATAAAANDRIGIDAVVLEPTTRSFAEETADPDEHARFREFVLERKLDPAVAPVVLFAVKEAALKWLGIGLRVALPSLVVHPIDATSLAFTLQGERVVARFALDVQDGGGAGTLARAVLTLVAPDDVALRRRVRVGCEP